MSTTTTSPIGAVDATGQEHTAPARSAGVFGGDGWVRFVASILARCYLTVTAVLVAIAVLPLMLGWSPLVILSGSMEPSISPGDVVLISPVPDGKDYGSGMVVAFEAAGAGGQTIVKVHRITESRDGGFVTQGDANADADSGILAPEDIHGAGRVLVPFVGSPMLWMRENPLALAAWLLGTLVAVVLAVPPRPAASRLRAGALGAVALVALSAGVASQPVPAYAAFTARSNTAATWSTTVLPAITAGRAESFSLLAARSISDSHPQDSDVAGNIGTAPGTSISGIHNAEVHGSIERNTVVAHNAMTDANALAAALDARTATPHAGTLSGRVTPGVYSAGTFTTAGTVMLDAGGDPSARFVFVATSLSVAAGTTITLAGGAKASNVYWRITGAANLAPGTMFRGTLLASGNVTAGPMTVVGRLVSLTGDISVTRIVVTKP
jgi:signal peptidase I